MKTLTSDQLNKQINDLLNAEQASHDYSKNDGSYIYPQMRVEGRKYMYTSIDDHLWQYSGPGVARIIDTRKADKIELTEDKYGHLLLLYFKGKPMKCRIFFKILRLLPIK